MVDRSVRSSINRFALDPNHESDPFTINRCGHPGAYLMTLDAIRWTLGVRVITGQTRRTWHIATKCIDGSAQGSSQKKSC